MADWLSAVVTAVSAIAVYAAYWARRSARGTFAHTAYELARTLHADLTTGATAQARDVLEHFRSGTRYHELGRRSRAVAAPERPPLSSRTGPSGSSQR